MECTERAAQETGADGIFNRGTPTKDPWPTAKGEERIQKGEKFMQEWSIPVMDECVRGLKDGKERTIVLACIKRKESKTIAKIAEEMRRPPDTVRSWLARGRERGLYDLADHKPPGKTPTLDRTIVETIRGWKSKSPTDFGYKRKRWQCKTMQRMIREKLDKVCSEDIVRRTMHRIRFLYRKSRPAPPQVRLRGEAKELQGGDRRTIGQTGHFGLCHTVSGRGSLHGGRVERLRMAARRRPRNHTHELVEKVGAPDWSIGERVV